MKKDNHMMADDDDEDSGLEFEQPPAKTLTGGAKTFRDFLG